MADDPITDGGDDVGWWECSLCTFKNSSDKFKCEMCDLRRGTSTRKPRCNADTIVAQVVKQQEQIRQQTRQSKTPKIGTNNSSTSTNNSSTNIRSSTSTGTGIPATSTESSQNAPGRNRNRKSSDNKKSRKQKSSNNNDQSEMSCDVDEDNSATDSDVTDDHSHSSSPKIHRVDSETSLDTDCLSSSQSSASSSSESSPSSSPEPTTSSPIPSTKDEVERTMKIEPIEINGNLIQYSPPTSEGRAGLSIDKKRFTQHSVTVNDVTVTFTEFATRQNRYIRKKKRRRDGSRPKSSSNGRNRASKSSSKAV